MGPGGYPHYQFLVVKYAVFETYAREITGRNS
jgi:hypothetical protein